MARGIEYGSDVIELILLLRGEGYSYRAIAEALRVGGVEGIGKSTVCDIVLRYSGGGDG